MSNLFSMDGKLFSALDKMANLILLNVIYLLCCIPVITAGAATTALFYVTLKMSKNEEGYIIRSFFKSFRQNFKQATVIWVIALLLGVVFVLDFRIVSSMQGGLAKILPVLFGVIGIFYIFCLTYVFPLLSRFDNTVKNTVKNALLMSIRHLPYTILLIVMILAPLAAAAYISFLLMAMFLIGFAFIAYYTSFIYVKIFQQYMPGEDGDTQN